MANLFLFVFLLFAFFYDNVFAIRCIWVTAGLVTLDHDRGPDVPDATQANRNLSEL